MEDFSLIILCRGRRHLLPLTLDTLQPQSGAFEVILLDGEGSGRLPEIARRYPRLKIKVEDASGRALSAMMNQGLKTASGAYVQFLEPGDRYISQQGLAFLTELIIPKPPLITARGIAPDAQSHWLCRQTALELGGFDERLASYPMMDFLFRLQAQGRQPLQCRRALVDAVQEERGGWAETYKILYRHFGFWKAITSLFRQSHTQLWSRATAFIKQAFWREN
jgi:glycosyltransferase involved in cell wall biosynthesis